jgi:hypothetical protein
MVDRFGAKIIHPCEVLSARRSGGQRVMFNGWMISAPENRHAKTLNLASPLAFRTARPLRTRAAAYLPRLRKWLFVFRKHLFERLKRRPCFRSERAQRLFDQIQFLIERLRVLFPIKQSGEKFALGFALGEAREC